MQIYTQKESTDFMLNELNEWKTKKIKYSKDKIFVNHCNEMIKMLTPETKKETYPKYITKVNIKPTYTIGENILFYILSFSTLYGLIYALCTIISLIELITL